MSSMSRAVPSSPDPAGQACYLSASNAQAWQAVYSSVDAYTRGQVAAVVSDSAHALVDAFSVSYTHLTLPTILLV